MNEQSKISQENNPKLLELLNHLREEVQFMDENSTVIDEKVHSIADFRSNDQEKVSEEEPRANGLLNDFWECVIKMRKCNNVLNESRKSLTRLVG